jgi:hypothetical protein
MSKYLTIKRLMEADELMTPAPIGQIKSMDQFQATQGNQNIANDAPEQPQMEPMEEPQLALPSGEIMGMTIGDFLTKVESINPLIGIGLKTFIDSNMDQLSNVQTPQVEEPNTDVTFSNAIEDSPEVSQFDEPADQLSFPQ